MEGSGNNVDIRRKKRAAPIELECPDVLAGLIADKVSSSVGSVMVERVSERLCSVLEPRIYRIVTEAMEDVLRMRSHAKRPRSPSRRSTPQRTEGTRGRKLQLHFRSRLPCHLFIGAKVEGDQGMVIHIMLIDANTGEVVLSGPESTAKLNVVVLEGDFNEDVGDDWTKEHFESYEVKGREGKGPLLTGDLQVTLKEGVGSLGNFSFTDNSSWTRSRKFRLGVKVADGSCDGIRIREAKTEAFFVKEHRSKFNEKHYPPVLHDEVWRLKGVKNHGERHRKLVAANITTVADFLGQLVRDPQILTNILGSSSTEWNKTVDHAKTCQPGRKLYVFYSDETQGSGVVFNQISELRGLITNGRFLTIDSLSDDQKDSVDLLVKRAYDNWNHAIEYDSEDMLLPTKSTQESQRFPTVTGYKAPTDLLLPSTNSPVYQSPETEMPVQTERAINDHSSLPALSGGATSSLDISFSPMYDRFFEHDPIEEFFRHCDLEQFQCSFSMNSVGHSSNFSEDPFVQKHQQTNPKAVIGWLKVKAAFAWGIFVRNRAAKRRALLVELDGPMA